MGRCRGTYFCIDMNLAGDALTVRFQALEAQLEGKHVLFVGAGHGSLIKETKFLL